MVSSIGKEHLNAKSVKEKIAAYKEMFKADIPFLTSKELKNLNLKQPLEQLLQALGTSEEIKNRKILDKILVNTPEELAKAAEENYYEDQLSNSLLYHVLAQQGTFQKGLETFNAFLNSFQPTEPVNHREMGLGNIIGHFASCKIKGVNYNPKAQFNRAILMDFDGTITVNGEGIIDVREPGHIPRAELVKGIDSLKAMNYAIFITTSGYDLEKFNFLTNFSEEDYRKSINKLEKDIAKINKKTPNKISAHTKYKLIRQIEEKRNLSLKANKFNGIFCVPGQGSPSAMGKIYDRILEQHKILYDKAIIITDNKTDVSRTNPIITLITDNEISALDWANTVSFIRENARDKGVSKIDFVNEIYKQAKTVENHKSFVKFAGNAPVELYWKEGRPLELMMQTKGTEFKILRTYHR